MFLVVLHADVGVIDDILVTAHALSVSHFRSFHVLAELTAPLGLTPQQYFCQLLISLGKSSKVLEHLLRFPQTSMTSIAPS